MVMELENTPRPSTGMSSSSRTLLWAPSAPIRYRPLRRRRRPLSTSCTVSVTPSASWSTPTASCPSSTSAPADWARRRRIGSRPGCETNSRRQGLSASTPSLRLAMMSASLRPESESMMTSAPSGSNSFSDCSRTSSSMPALRNISSVRMWKNAARGSGEPPRRRSTARDAMPCWARNIAMDSPIRPPPAIRTGASRSIGELSEVICTTFPSRDPGKARRRRTGSSVRPGGHPANPQRAKWARLLCVDDGSSTRADAPDAVPDRCYVRPPSPRPASGTAPVLRPPSSQDRRRRPRRSAIGRRPTGRRSTGSCTWSRPRWS